MRGCSQDFQYSELILLAFVLNIIWHPKYYDLLMNRHSNYQDSGSFLQLIIMELDLLL